MRKYRKPYRAKKRKSIFKSLFFWIPILSILFFSGLFYLFFFSPIFQVKDINISGNQKVKNEDILKLVEGKIPRNFIFPTKSIFLVNSNEINKSITDNFPQIANTNLTKKIPDSLELRIEERKAISVFCQTDKCFFIDKSGIIFEEASANGFKIENLNSGDIKIGDKVIEDSLMSKILEIRKKVEQDFKIPLEKISLISNDRINVKTQEGWEIYFNPEKDVNWQIAKLKADLDEEIPAENRKNLEYIELRFGNFANYKYKNLPEVQPTKSD